MNADKAGGMEEPVGDHLATIDWQRGAWSDKKGKYSRQHVWVLGRTTLKATDSGAVVPAGYRDNAPIDPYNMFVATIASAHMLTWLHIAFGMEIEVERYIDRAHGVLSELEGGDCWISEVILTPKITLKAGLQMTPEGMAHLHEHAQQHCYIARSIKTKVTVRSG
jgi:organic hydroperoxide reductase OsmC/OhrA